MRIKTKLFGLKIRSKRRGMHFQKVCRKEIQEISGVEEKFVSLLFIG